MFAIRNRFRCHIETCRNNIAQFLNSESRHRREDSEAKNQLAIEGGRREFIFAFSNAWHFEHKNRLKKLIPVGFKG